LINGRQRHPTSQVEIHLQPMIRTGRLLERSIVVVPSERSDRNSKSRIRRRPGGRTHVEGGSPRGERRRHQRPSPQ
jgi:hypothetical protein